jgi:hypothetical protein
MINTNNLITVLTFLQSDKLKILRYTYYPKYFLLYTAMPKTPPTVLTKTASLENNEPDYQLDSSTMITTQTMKQLMQ